MRTDPKINEEIKSQTVRNLNTFKNCNMEDISKRINTLDQEWDTERVLEVNASLVLLLSSYLGVKTSRMWFLLTGAVGVFMLQHALQGWCPPLPYIRKWGVRTADEINSEKTALKIMRGDYKGEYTSVDDLLNMTEKQ